MMTSRTLLSNRETEALFEEKKACILLPTYNNGKTITDVVQCCLQLTSHVVVVNDGSTDDTLALLEKFQVQVLSERKNRGKGYALAKGFAWAIQQGYQYAVSIDTDGQHMPDDAISLLHALPADDPVLLIGARNMQQADIPVKSTFGNRFSNFWFRLETGIRLPDTQSGFRVYPVQCYRNWHFFTHKFEFEIEVLVRTAWKGIPVRAVPVRVHYPEADKRVTHFRPLRDFFRISVLNTVLVLLTFLYIKPLNLVIRPLRRQGLKKSLRSWIWDPEEPVLKTAGSLAFGIFMGIFPIWGFQLLIGIPLAIVFRMNKALFILAANISLFPPVIWFASLAMGRWLDGNPVWTWPAGGFHWSDAMKAGKEFIWGGVVLALLAGGLTFLISYVWLSRIRRRKNKSVS